MSDSILIQNGCAHQIWRGVAKSALPPMTADLLAAVVEMPADTVNEGYVWNGIAFTAPPPPPPSPIIPYATFRARWQPAELQLLHTARSSSWQIDDYVGLAQAQNAVNLAGTTAVDAKAALVSAAVLTQARADVIFAVG